MGKPSDKRRRARRPGRRERVRVKNSRSRNCYFASVGGAGTASVTAGRKKRSRVIAYVNRVLDAARHAGDSIPKDQREIKRPLYTINLDRIRPHP